MEMMADSSKGNLLGQRKNQVDMVRQQQQKGLGFDIQTAHQRAEESFWLPLYGGGFLSLPI